MKYTDKDRKKFIYKRTVLSPKICDCCHRKIKLDTMWLVQRYNSKGEFNDWYYCFECFDSKDELLLEIDTDSYPYGIFPIDFEFKKKRNTWALSLSDIYRKPNIPLRNRNLTKKRVKR